MLDDRSTKKLKLTGVPYKIIKNTDFINDMISGNLKESMSELFLELEESFIETR